MFDARCRDSGVSDDVKKTSYHHYHLLVVDLYSTRIVRLEPNHAPHRLLLAAPGVFGVGVGAGVRQGVFGTRVHER